MKDYKQKYEEAVKKFEKFFNDNDDRILYKHDIEKIFPELRDSEDEKIRKALKEAVCYYWNDDTQAKLDCLAWLEKQGEQKPTDRFESKFKAGDWIVYCNEVVDLITGIEDNGYLIYKGGCIPFTCQGDVRLWTIQDAKDGDVLAAHECLVLFKEIDGLNIKCYCTYHFMNSPIFRVDTLQNKLVFHPSTKEQRNLLFYEMKKAGYEWDAENKELKKIEQKPAWSEEDKRISNEIQCLISNYRTDDDEHKLCSWIDNIKSRVQPQPKQEWSEEDEIGFHDAMWAIEQARTIAKDENDMGNLWYAENWLKSIKERMKGE